MTATSPTVPVIKCIDFFCGAGGTSAGLMRAGIQIVAGIDNDSDAATTFKSNFPGASLLESDIRELTETDLESYVGDNEDDVWLFSACAPCQPFTRHRLSNESDDDRADLLLELLRFLHVFVPDLLFIENVPGLAASSESFGPFRELLETLDRLGYWNDYGEFNCWDFGRSTKEAPVRAGRKPPLAQFRYPARPMDQVHLTQSTQRFGSGSAICRDSMRDNGTNPSLTTKQRPYQL